VLALLDRLRSLGRRRSRPDRPLAQDPLLALAAAEPRRRWEAAEVLGAVAAQAQTVAALTQALNDPEPFVRWQAGRSLVALNTEESFQALADSLQAPSPVQRAAAAEALGHSQWPAVIPLLAEALTDADAGVRVAGALALGRLRRAEGTPYLAAALQTETSPGVRWALTRALGMIGVPTGAQALYNCLISQWEEPQVRRSAVWAAGRMGWDATAVAALLTALEDPDAPTRWQACLSLGQVTQEAVRSGLADRAAVAAVREGLGRLREDGANAGQGLVGEAAAQALAQIEAALWARRGKEKEKKESR
jgi:HEAT repeat protein